MKVVRDRATGINRTHFLFETKRGGIMRHVAMTKYLPETLVGKKNERNVIIAVRAMPR